MKRKLLDFFLLTIVLLVIQLSGLTQQIGDPAINVKYIVEQQVEQYYNSQGYHQVQMDYNIAMSNGKIAEVILQKEKVPDVYFGREVSFRIRYIMKEDFLNEIVQEYFDVSEKELRQAYKDNFQGNRINSYFFNADYTICTSVFLGANSLASVRTKKTATTDFPVELRELVKKNIAKAEKESIEEKKREIDENLRKLKEEDEYKTTLYDLQKYDSAAYQDFIESIKFQIKFYLNKELPNFISLRYREKYNGSIEFNNSYRISYRLEDRSIKSEIRGNTVIAGTNNIVTDYDCILISGSDSGCIVARNFQVGLPMVKINGKKWLSQVVIDTLTVKFIRGIAEVRCGKKGFEFTKFEPMDHVVKSKIISMGSGKLGKFIVEYQIGDVWGDKTENIAFKPFERLSYPVY